MPSSGCVLVCVQCKRINNSDYIHKRENSAARMTLLLARSTRVSSVYMREDSTELWSAASASRWLGRCTPRAERQPLRNEMPEKAVRSIGDDSRRAAVERRRRRVVVNEARDSAAPEGARNT